MENFKVVILSARISNLEGAVHSVLENEPKLAASRIIVVDDGAQADRKPLFPGVTWVPGVKPFVFSRNTNIGFVAAGDSDVVLMNDDARLKTPEGFSKLAALAGGAGKMGLISAAISGYIGNAEQMPKGLGLRPGPFLAFVCVYIRRSAYRLIGPLDERFVGYGCEDGDYCERAREAGVELGVADQCIVSHGEVPSTYRTRPDFNVLFDQNIEIYRRKKSGN